MKQLDVFTSPLCGPCQQLKPLLEGLAPGRRIKPNYIDTSTDAGHSLAEEAGVRGVPTMMYKGEVLHVGMMSLPDLNTLLRAISEREEEE